MPQLGVFPDQASIDNYTWFNPKTGKNEPIQPLSKPGELKYKDTNNDGTISADDRTVVGSPHPKFTLGMGIDMKYKRWTFNAFINAVVGKDMYNASNAALLNTRDLNKQKWDQAFGNATTVSTRLLDSWTPTNTITDIPRLGANSSYSGASAILSSVEHADFVRLENIAISYSVPVDNISFLSKLSLKIGRAHV